MAVQATIYKDQGGGRAMKTKQYLLVTVVGVTLFAALMNLPAVLEVVKNLIGLVLPIIAGSILALFINVPMNGIKKQLKKVLQNARKQPSDKSIHIFSFIFTLCLVFLVLVAVLTLLVPEIVRSSRNLYDQIETSIPQWLEYLDAQQINAEWLEDLLSDMDNKQMMEHITQGVDALLPNVVNALTSTVSGLMTAAFAVIISIYMTLGKERVCRHARKLVCAYLKPGWAKGILHFCQVFQKSFTKFLTGQCTEALILGTLMFTAFKLFHLPYGSLVGVLTAVCAIIPYMGAFISCGVSIFLTVLFDPTLVIRCALVYLAVQFIENQLIYPRVVGDSVGLPPLYTLIAAMIGGKLFGILGILFFIPLMAVAVELVREDADQRLKIRKNLSLYN